ncbi:hypothetical protein [Niallia sp. Krafla_26]|uniref:hypothetical protein n=1 Tax=Niallia sp. Krafla_26 TaxID=3064703 RepID=UPI003D16B576
MFPLRPRRPFPPRYRHQRQMYHRKNPTKPNIFSEIYDTVGNLDVEKMKNTAESLKQLYSEISPIFTKANKK